MANKEVNNVIAEGYPVSQMLSQVKIFISLVDGLAVCYYCHRYILKLCCFQLFEMVVEADGVSDEQKSRIFKKLGEADKVSVSHCSQKAYFCF